MANEPWKFKPGNQMGKGRPKKMRRIPDLLAKIGKLNVQDDPLIPDALKAKFKDIGKVTNLDAVIRMVYIYALKGQSWAVQFIAERTEGKVPDEIKHDFQSENPRYTDEELARMADALDSDHTDIDGSGDEPTSDKG